MSATKGTKLGVYEGSSVLTAFDNPTQLDILQIVGKQGGTLLAKVDYSGAVVKNPSSFTNGSMMGCIVAPGVTGSSTLADIFAAAFPPSPGTTEDLDIFQVITPDDGSEVYIVDYQGTSTIKTLVSISVTPKNPTVEYAAGPEQFTATATYADGSTADLTASATWSSATPATATIRATTGLATLVLHGTSVIHAVVGAIDGYTTLTVSCLLSSIAVTPASSFTMDKSGIPNAASQQMAAQGTYDDASTADLTSTATWASSQGTKVAVSSGGLATIPGTTYGASNVTATLSGVTSNTVVITSAAGS